MSNDRVHSGHARKMVAKMKPLGHDVMHYENIEDGYGGAANQKQLKDYNYERFIGIPVLFIINF